jgi:hypothetical protein
MLACRGEVVEIRDRGVGNEYMSGKPITLPAASLATNLFRSGTQLISNRLHTARAARFDSSGRLAYMTGEPASAVPSAGGATPPANGAGSATLKTGLQTAEAVPPPGDGADSEGFPPYLIGQQYVWFLQNVRHYTNYECAVTVDRPSTFYLLVDNRVNDYGPESSYDDPRFGPPDTQWIVDDGWQRVDTGLTPLRTETNRGDYVGIDEGNNGSINQVYAVFSKQLRAPGSVTLRTELDGNIYCLVVSTNPAGPAPTATAAK